MIRKKNQSIISHRFGMYFHVVDKEPVIRVSFLDRQEYKIVNALQTLVGRLLMHLIGFQWETTGKLCCC